MGEYGDASVDGDVDFFPNLGITQPGCNLGNNYLKAIFSRAKFFE
jgi:hypothetical protein